MKRNESVHAGMKILRAPDVSDAWVSYDEGGTALRPCPPAAVSVLAVLLVLILFADFCV